MNEFLRDDLIWGNIHVEYLHTKINILIHLNIQINEHKNTNMFMYIIIYCTNVFEDSLFSSFGVYIVTW